ncbi:hypothetical protein pb186bvf_002607 [Paramecium bursaria]
MVYFALFSIFSNKRDLLYIGTKILRIIELIDKNFSNQKKQIIQILLFMHLKQDGIISFKYRFNTMFKQFNGNIQRFEKIFQIQMMLDNIKQFDGGEIQKQEQFSKLLTSKVSTNLIKQHYDALFYRDGSMLQYPEESIYEIDTIFLQLESLYLSPLNLKQNETVDLTERLVVLQNSYKTHFLFQCTKIYYQCQELLNLKNIQYHMQFEFMAQLIILTHQKPVEMIMSMNLKKFKNTIIIENYELLSQSIKTFTQIYACKQSFSGLNYVQLSMLLQYLERLLEFDFKEHQSNEFMKFEYMVNVTDQYANFDQALQKYSLKLLKHVNKKLGADQKITQKIRFYIRKMFKSQLVQNIMKDIQQSLKLPIDLSWSFLPWVSLVIIPDCNFKGCSLRDNGISINLTPFLSIYEQGFTNGYKDMMYAYCILVAINGWNCQQLIKKTQKSFYWYDDHLQHLNLDEFQLYKQVFGITYLEENRQLFSLQYLNQDTAKLILSIGDQQYTKDELHHQFRLLSGPHLQQTQLALFKETLEEQEQLNLKLE